MTKKVNSPKSREERVIERKNSNTVTWKVFTKNMTKFADNNAPPCLFWDIMIRSLNI